MRTNRNQFNTWVREKPLRYGALTALSFGASLAIAQFLHLLQPILWPFYFGLVGGGFIAGTLIGWLGKVKNVPNRPKS